MTVVTDKLRLAPRPRWQLLINTGKPVMPRWCKIRSEVGFQKASECSRSEGFGALGECGGPLADHPVHVEALWRRGSKVTVCTPGMN